MTNCNRSHAVEQSRHADIPGISAAHGPARLERRSTGSIIENVRTKSSPWLPGRDLRTRPHPTALSLLPLWCVILLAGSVVAQPMVGAQPGAKYYVWGQVRAPGAYSFVANPDIVELLSTAGGPTDNANLKHVILIQAVTQKRTGINLQAMLASGQVLRLAPGDVVIVPSTAWPSLRDGLTVLTSLASLTSVVVTIILLTKSK